MKKVCCVLAMAVIPFAVYAKDVGNLLNEQIGGREGSLPKTGSGQLIVETDRNKLQLSPMAVSEDKMIAFLLNFFVGLGVGSYTQGDIAGGVIGTAGELGGVGMVVGGMVMEGNSVMEGSGSGKGLPLMISGFIVMLATRIFEYIRPWTYG
jgi:hypothetical protein